MFFTKSELAKQAKEEIDIDRLQSHCGQCKLNLKVKSPKMEYTGDGKKKILVIGQFPSLMDDNNVIQFSDDAGDVLRETLKKNKINLNRDCWKVNAVRCHTGADKRSKNAKLCSGYIHKMIYQLKPKLIIVLGEDGLTTLFNDFKIRTIKRWRGIVIPDEKFQTNIFCTFDPKEIVEDPYNKNLKITFERDIKKAISRSTLDFLQAENLESKVKLLTDSKSVINLLNAILTTKPVITYDYETTGLKPYKTGHKIASVSLAISINEAYAFPYEYNTHWTSAELVKIKALWRKILADREIKKIMHNYKFEDTWSAIIFGQRPMGTVWDSMMAAHILDNRKYSTSLKFQVFLRYGVRPYDEHIEHYLKSSNENEFNTVMKCPLKELLIYNGLDCLYTYRLYEDQKSELNGRKGLLSANAFFTRALSVMGTMQLNGIRMNEEYYIKQRKQLTYRIKKLKRGLEKGREAKKFYKHFNRRINITSNHDLGKLFYEVLGKTPYYTAKNNYKTDKDTLKKLNLPFVENLLDMKRLEKARGTYLAQFAREVFDEKMHPFFDLHIPVTYRSSSSKPNFQNQPKRDEEIMMIIRSGLIPRIGRVLCEIDFSGAEVITSLCYHKDPTFHAYLLDKSTDMHRDQALDLWQLDRIELENPDFTRAQEKLAKDIRFFAKNGWTFAQFYGDWYDSCARTLWESCIKGGDLSLPSGQKLVDHINSKGIYDEEDFSNWCKGVEDRLWNERFPQYTQWKKDIVKFYQRHGYIETFFGFRFTGYMDRKQCTNYPIQGTSFHLLVDTILEVNKFIRKNKLKTKLIGQIHDSLIADIPLNELEFYTNGVNNIIHNLKEKFKWLLVPMEMEAEISFPYELGGSFSSMYEIKPDVLANFDFRKIYKDAMSDEQYNFVGSNS